MTVPATNVEGRDFRRGSAFSVDKKPKHSKFLTMPSLCHLMFTACLTLNVLLTICGLSVKKKKEKKKAEAVQTILCRSIAPFLRACVCVCISSLLKESQRLSSCLHNKEHDSKDVELNPSNNIMSVFLSSKWSKMYEMNSHTDKERDRERDQIC